MQRAGPRRGAAGGWELARRPGGWISEETVKESVVGLRNEARRRNRGNRLNVEPPASAQPTQDRRFRHRAEILSQSRGASSDGVFGPLVRNGWGYGRGEGDQAPGQSGDGCGTPMRLNARANSYAAYATYSRCCGRGLRQVPCCRSPWRSRGRVSRSKTAAGNGTAERSGGFVRGLRHVLRLLRTRLEARTPLPESVAQPRTRQP